MRKSTHLILGSTECKKVVGEATYCAIGLEVASEIHLNTFSAERKLLGTHFSQFLAFPTSSLFALQLIRGGLNFGWQWWIKKIGILEFRVNLSLEIGEFKVLLVLWWKEGSKGRVRFGWIWRIWADMAERWSLKGAELNERGKAGGQT